MNLFNDKKPKISIGLPVYNGERFLRLKINSIINQTYENFELIISNNGSTDKTHEICQEYAIKDERIKYFQHKKNYGAIWNFEFVLNKAKYDYFMWTSVDDMLLTEFVEKNLQTLEKNKKAVASISKIDFYEPENENQFIGTYDLKYYDNIKKIRNIVRPRNVFPISGNFESKSRIYLKKSTCQVFYSIFKTEIIKKSFIKDSFLGNDWAIFLNVLKYGDLAVVNQMLMKQYERGASGKGLISSTKQFNHGINIIFPWYALTKWCEKRYGIKFILKNLDYFIQLNLEGVFSLLIDLAHICLKKIKG